MYGVGDYISNIQCSKPYNSLYVSRGNSVEYSKLKRVGMMDTRGVI